MLKYFLQKELMMLKKTYVNNVKTRVCLKGYIFCHSPYTVFFLHLSFFLFLLLLLLFFYLSRISFTFLEFSLISMSFISLSLPLTLFHFRFYLFKSNIHINPSTFQVPNCYSRATNRMLGKNVTVFAIF